MNAPPLWEGCQYVSFVLLSSEARPLFSLCSPNNASLRNRPPTRPRQPTIKIEGEYRIEGTKGSHQPPYFGTSTLFSPRASNQSYQFALLSYRRAPWNGTSSLRMKEVESLAPSRYMGETRGYWINRSYAQREKGNSQTMLSRGLVNCLMVSKGRTGRRTKGRLRNSGCPFTWVSNLIST